MLLPTFRQDSTETDRAFTVIGYRTAERAATVI